MPGTLRSLSVAALLLLAAQASNARAQSDTEPVRRGYAADAVAQGLVMPTLIAPGTGRSRAVAQVVGGYDGAEHTAVLRASADVQIIGPLDARVGLTYTPDALNGEAQPHFGLRLRALSQASHGIDLAFAAFYRMERFTDDEGLIQGLIALARRFGRVGLFANIAYGQDPEGDDREADFALAGLYAASEALQLGLETHFRVDLFSDDPKRDAREDSEWELTVGPTLHYSLGPVALFTQLGFRALMIGHVESGAIALAGLGGTY